MLYAVLSNKPRIFLLCSFFEFSPERFPGSPPPHSGAVKSGSLLLDFRFDVLIRMQNINK